MCETCGCGMGNPNSSLHDHETEPKRVELEEKVLFNVNQLIMPYLDKLKRRKLDAKQRAYAEILE